MASKAKMAWTILLAPLIPVALSALGPIYAGYNNKAFSQVVVWALICAGAFVWRSKPSIRYAIESERAEGTWTPWSAPRLVAMIAVQMVLMFLAGHSALYYLVRQISN
jgi:hypothetical protein